MPLSNHPFKADKSMLGCTVCVGSRSFTQSSPSPELDYIATEAMFRPLGVENKGEKAWNAKSNNQKVLRDKAFVMNRLRDKILADKPMDGDDDAAAVMWTGMFLCCATKALDESQPVKPEIDTGSRDLFHTLWGEAAEYTYDKDRWIDLQRRLGF